MLLRNEEVFRHWRRLGLNYMFLGLEALDEEGLKAAVQTVADGIDVQGDIHASAEYRAHLARVLTRRAVLQAAERAKG